MISPKDFVEVLKKNDFSNFTGVPCSFFQAAINYVLDQPSLRYTMVPNEGSGLALAAGAYLAGKPTVVLIQNSGFGNLVNPLTSLNMIYDLPVLIFMSGRAYGVKDEPQHEIIGQTMAPILQAMGIKFQDMPLTLGDYQKSVAQAAEYMKAHKKPFIFLVRKDTIDEYTPDKVSKNSYPLKRIQAIQIIADTLSGDEFIIATTGKPSRELFSVADRKNNFYMQGSMGHAPSIGLGVALAKPNQKIVILDGDGALLMHLGILSSIGHYKPKNFYHIALDNEAYETTGDQDTTSRNTDFSAIAKSCGYKNSSQAKTASELKSALKKMLIKPGPSFLRVKINRLPTDNIPRISSKYDSKTIGVNFKKALEKI